MSSIKANILVAGVGNELRQDDAFGVAVIKAMQKEAIHWEGVRLIEVGIGGIHLVQELHSGYDTMILLDAVQWGNEAGHLQMRQVDRVADLSDMPLDQKREFLVDMHYTNPHKALMLAKALNVLPEKVYLLGCEAAGHLDFGVGMSKAVQQAIPKAVSLLSSWIEEELISC